MRPLARSLARAGGLSFWRGARFALFSTGFALLPQARPLSEAAAAKLRKLCTTPAAPLSSAGWLLGSARWLVMARLAACFSLRRRLAEASGERLQQKRRMGREASQRSCAPCELVRLRIPLSNKGGITSRAGLWRALACELGGFCICRRLLGV